MPLSYLTAAHGALATVWLGVREAALSPRHATAGGGGSGSIWRCERRYYCYADCAACARPG